MSQNPLFKLINGEFNICSSTWWKNDLTKSEGSQVDDITWCYRLSQLIRKPTHILSNLSLSIDMIFYRSK